MKRETTAIFAGDGPLAKALDNYAPRHEQVLLAQAIEQAIENLGILISEAGTGTGKTFAYLVPALLSDKKVLVSTGTKALQDQLFHRDLPMVRKALNAPGKVVLLKGRSNYLCKYKLEHGFEASLLPSLETVHHIEKIRRLAPRTKMGDTAEIDDIPEDSAAWPFVTSTADSCLGAECAFYHECYLVKARRKALDADVIVVNHYLFFADLLMKDEKLGELLPNVDVIILDEAHQLPEIASHFFGLRIGSRSLQDLVHDILQEKKQHADDMASLSDNCDRLKVAILDMRFAMGEQGVKAPWQMLSKRKEIIEVIAKIETELTSLLEHLLIAKERSKGLENCYERLIEAKNLFKVLTGETPSDQIHWFETFIQSFSIHFTPMSIAKQFQDIVNEKDRAWIFTSATLTIENKFMHFRKQIGLEELHAEELFLKSPFDFRAQSILYAPRGMPEPKDKKFFECMLQVAIPLINLCQGRTFLLFTSYHALKIVEKELKDLIDFPILVQGSLPKEKLLSKYRKLGNAVLLATSSFWEGVDVRGEALSCVIIDKLPFAAPDDPVLKARTQKMRKQNIDPFKHYQLPQAVISLKQGAGRLIRDVTDTGILAICDPRLVSKDYGLAFIESLPTMTRTRDFDTVRAFWERVNNPT